MTFRECCCCCVGVLRPFDTFQVMLTYPHCSWASLHGRLPVLSAHSFASNWQLPLLNQQKGENGRRNYFMTKFHERMLPDVRADHPHTRRTCIRSSYRARPFVNVNESCHIVCLLSFSLRILSINTIGEYSTPPLIFSILKKLWQS